MSKHQVGKAVMPGLERRALEQLYAQYAPVVHRRALVLVRRDADAWDVVQEVFEKMLSALDTFRGEARPMTWVYRITTNVALNHLRARQLREPRHLSVVEEPSADQSATETRQLISRWLSGLSERETELATLLYIDGLTQDEAADVLGVSRKTIGRDVDAMRVRAAALDALPKEATHG